MVIAPPSVRGDGEYRWLNDNDIAEAPQWLIDAAVAASKSSGKGADNGAEEPQAPIERIRAAFAVIPNNDRGWDDWNRCGLALFRATAGSDDGLAVFHAWSSKSKKYKLQVTADRWADYKTSPPTKIGAGSIFHWANEASPGWEMLMGMSLEQAMKLAALTALSAFEYEMRRKAAAREMGMRTSVLDSMIDRLRPRGADDDDDDKRGHAVTFPESEPWSAPGSDGREASENATNPIAALMKLRDAGANTNTLMAALNQNFAVVRRGSKVRIGYITGKDIDFMLFDDFHNMLGNLIFKKTVVISRRWLKWKNRRQYVGRGVVFEPGGPLEVVGDMLNLWRGFGVEPKQGDWSALRNHIRDVACQGNEEHFQYTIKWMAYGVQYLDRPVGTMPAFRGEEGAGKGIIWRNYGRLFGKHFKHITHGEQLTGRFNAVLGDACFVFLDEALWAGDRKGDNILRALITEDTFQLELKYFDPITVKNRLRLGTAGNSQWIVPVSPRGRRNFVLDVSDQYADESDPAHAVYWSPLQEQFGDYAPDDGRAAMLYDLLHMDLKGFNILAVPKSAAKTEQKLLTQTGTEAWLFEVLQDGAINALIKAPYGGREIFESWDEKGMTISRDDAYQAYLQFSQERREYKPRGKVWWSRDLRKILKDCVSDTRPYAKDANRTRYLVFHPLEKCRATYSEYLDTDDIEWDADA